MDRNHISKRLCFWYAILWILLIVALYLSFGVYFVDTTSTKSKWVGLFAGSIAILLAVLKMLEISLYKSVNPLFKKITRYFTNGSLIFVSRIFKITLPVILLISCFLISKMGFGFVVSLICGSVFGFLAIFATSLISARITTRSSQFYNESQTLALKQFLNSGTAISSVCVAFSIIPIVILFHIFKDYQVINGFLLGACFFSLVNNISSLSSKQACECSDDVACSNFSQLEKKDRRNPLLLLGGITKGILNVNVLASTIYTLFSVALISTMTVGGEFLLLMGAFLPIAIMACGIFSSVIVSLLINTKNIKNPIRVLFGSMFFANSIFCTGSYFLIKNWFPMLTELTIPVSIGAFGGILCCFLYIRYLNEQNKPVINVANLNGFGFEMIFKQTIKESFGTIFPFALIIAISIIVSFLSVNGMQEPSLGVYGVMLFILGLLSTSIVVIAKCAFGFLIKNVDVVLDSYEEEICDKNTIVSGTFNNYGKNIVSLIKAFLNFATIFVSIGALIAYSLLAGFEEADILNPFVMGALFIGACIPFLFCSNIMGLISKTVKRLLFEVKNQLKTNSQILRFELRPNYEKCVNICALNTTVHAIVLSVIVILIAALVVLKLQVEALFGFVFGVLISSFGLIFFTSASSIISKSARNLYEKEFKYNTNNEEAGFMTVNQIIFTSIKELIVPSLNSLVVFLAVLALSLAPLFG